MYSSERQIGDDGDSLTEMIEASPAELFSHDDARYQRNVSHIREVFDRRTYLFKQFWDLPAKVTEMLVSRHYPTRQT
jgi:hypothetical protein